MKSVLLLTLFCSVAFGDLKEAHCDMTPNTELKKKSQITGHIHMRQVSRTKIRVDVSLHGLPTNKVRMFALHVHESNNTKKSCNSLGGHYNPRGVDHGSRDDTPSHRHAGDWGNIQANADGSVKTLFFDTVASLIGPESISGRSIVLHEGIDDLGKGGNVGSKTTGNAGKRLACCIITEPAMDGMHRDGDKRMQRDGHNNQSPDHHNHHDHYDHHGPHDDHDDHEH